MIETSRGVGGHVKLYDCRWSEHHARTIVGGWWTQQLCHKDTGADRSKLSLIKTQFSALIYDCCAESGTSGKSETIP